MRKVRSLLNLDRDLSLLHSPAALPAERRVLGRRGCLGNLWAGGWSNCRGWAGENVGLFEHPGNWYAGRVFPQPAGASNAGAFLTLPLACLLGFLVLITLLVLGTGPVHAGWELTSGNDLSKLTVYVDRDTIQRTGNLVKMWQLFDYKTVQTVAGDSLLSYQRYNEYDCSGVRTRMLAYTWFSSNMGRGRVVYKTTEAQLWASIVPRSIDHTLWKVACSKP